MYIPPPRVRESILTLFRSVSIYYFSPDEDEEPLAEKIKKKALIYCLKAVDIFCVWDCCWLWIKIQEVLVLIIFDPFVELFITLCIVVNTLFMAMDHYDMKEGFAHFLKMGNYVSSTELFYFMFLLFDFFFNYFLRIFLFH